MGFKDNPPPPPPQSGSRTSGKYRHIIRQAMVRAANMPKEKPWSYYEFDEPVTPQANGGNPLSSDRTRVHGCNYTHDPDPEIRARAVQCSEYFEPGYEMRVGWADEAKTRPCFWIRKLQPGDPLPAWGGRIRTKAKS